MGGGGGGRQRRRRLRGGGVGSANCQLTLVTPLADTFTTVLLPEEEEDSGAELEFGLALSPHRPDRQSGSSGAPSRPAGLQGGEEEEVVVPLSAQVQARLEGVCVQLDTFQAAAKDAARHATGAADSNAAAAASTLHSRLALLIRTLEVRDSFQPRKGGGAGSAAAAAAAATGWAGLRRMLGYHASVHRVRHPRSSQVQLVVEAIQAEPGTGKWAGRGPGCRLPCLRAVRVLSPRGSEAGGRRSRNHGCAGGHSRRRCCCLSCCCSRLQPSIHQQRRRARM